MMERVATCACGQLKVRCSGEPAKVSLCHCLACQRRTGSTYGIAAFFPHARARPEGVAHSYARSADSGHAVTFHFCPHCGASVYWQAARLSELLAVAVGAFADPGFPAPSQSVFTEHRHAWVRPPG